MKNRSLFNVGMDFFSGVLVGGLIGYGIDTYFSTKPFGICVFMILGFAAGINNVIKATKKKIDE